MSLPHVLGKAAKTDLPENYAPVWERGGIGIHTASGKMNDEICRTL
ncbi:hypothetical protein DFQ50_105123 [Pseudocitrobacter faecalis]|uniref:Uncharacterized protein n=1 Tax=Pseudocitrobacter faecalis TaxID=1398493 RepID=A0ABX9FVB9_9ENTR|nr:hypothetical protein DFQ50_105123 [Pseudocitrobacter faecalis]